MTHNRNVGVVSRVFFQNKIETALSGSPGYPYWAYLQSVTLGGSRFRNARFAESLCFGLFHSMEYFGRDIDTVALAAGHLSQYFGCDQAIHCHLRGAGSYIQSLNDSRHGGDRGLEQFIQQSQYKPRRTSLLKSLTVRSPQMKQMV